MNNTKLQGFIDTRNKNPDLFDKMYGHLLGGGTEYIEEGLVATVEQLNKGIIIPKDASVDSLTNEQKATGIAMMRIALMECQVRFHARELKLT